ncbi:MAG: phosphohistidine phosphatase SixA [Bryobacteraceae bacterium]|nr:phosphohistidine phosphatase SixA [Bryobacteraceae bacterium]
MQIHILRHGIAEDAKPGSPDADRALTPEGRKKLRDVLKLARGANVRPSLILTSPYRRAVETAEIASAVLDGKAEIVGSAALQPSGDPRDVWEEIRVHKDESELLLVSHEPLTSRLTGFLLNAPNLNVDFKKGALLRLDVDEFGAVPRGVLKWMLTAKLA